ncbi:MAG: hypothetical protein M3340_07715 [Actinomycetota bacterium]|nr:hypothetical protein [Actinomycetota bacterium]
MKRSISRAWHALHSAIRYVWHPHSSPVATSVQKRVDRPFVLTKCDYFVDVQVWPPETKLSPRAWLGNFTREEEPYALQLLNAFLYFSEPLTDALLLGGVADLTRLMVRPSARYAQAQARWTDFIDSLIVTYPTGEVPSPTDSGFAFARKARQVLGIPEERILSPDETLVLLMRRGPRPILFLDDFLGSGSQFVRTWHRVYPTPVGDLAFATIQSSLNFDAYYVPLIAAELGADHIKAQAPSVTVMPTHRLPPEYSALHRESLIWPAELRGSAAQVIEQASRRAGIPDTGGTTPEDWRGFAELGLCLAFFHSVPDATLPLFYWEENDWKPLVRRV